MSSTHFAAQIWREFVHFRDSESTVVILQLKASEQHSMSLARQQSTPEHSISAVGTAMSSYIRRYRKLFRRYRYESGSTARRVEIATTKFGTIQANSVAKRKHPEIYNLQNEFFYTTTLPNVFRLTIAIHFATIPRYGWQMPITTVDIADVEVWLWWLFLMIECNLRGS